MVTTMNIYPSRYSALSLSGQALLRLCHEIKPALLDCMSALQADSVLVRGNSGLSVAYVLHTIAPEIQFIIARKRAEQARSHGYMFEPMAPEGVNVKRCVVLDDLICTGSTIRQLHTDLHDEYGQCAPEIVGVLLYNNGGPFVGRRGFDLNNDDDHSSSPRNMIPVWFREYR